MTIRSDSYSSTTEVKAVTRHLLAGQSAFNSTTLPTATDVEKFIDRASGVLNVALAGLGFTPGSIHANSTAKLACDDFVTAEAAMWVELTQRGQGFSDGDNSRAKGFAGLKTRAETFGRNSALAFKRLGVSVADPSSQGLAFTGLTAQADRTDPDDATLAQPFARRGQFDNADST